MLEQSGAAEDNKRRQRAQVRHVAVGLYALGLLLLVVAFIDVALMPGQPDESTGRTHLLALIGKTRVSGHYATNEDITFIVVMVVLAAMAIFAGAQLWLRTDPAALYRAIMKNRGS